MITNTSKCMRSDQLFMRNEYAGRGKWNIPLVRKQELNVNNLSLIACSDTKSNDSSVNTQNGVHFFVDDYRFNGIYNNPEKSLAKYSQYAFLLTPDFSTYADMSLWRQISVNTMIILILMKRFQQFCHRTNITMLIMYGLSHNPML